jgi:hypothetical protein
MKKLELNITEYNNLLLLQHKHKFVLQTKVINNIFVALIPIGVAISLGF